jgi:hypothetical protein
MINLPKKLIFSSLAIVLVGILFGAYFAVKKDVQPGATPSSNTVPTGSPTNTFGGTFTNFIVGRTADGSVIRKDTPLVKAAKFFTGEKVGLRIQTSSEVTAAFPIELRFLRQDNNEETPSLQQYRQSFSIKPGLNTYCCLAIPKEAGKFTLGILRNDAFIGTIGGIVVVVPSEQDGLFLGI